MTTDEAIERVKVICAPPGSVLVFVVNSDTPQIQVDLIGAGLVKHLPQYQVIVMSDLGGVHAIVPESPPVVSHYHYNVAYSGAADLEIMRALKDGPQ